jgi:hypothetical protein
MSAVQSGTIKVEGLRETIKDLQALGVEKQDFVNVNLEAAEILMNAARPLVPVRSGKLLGSMRASKTVQYAQVSLGRAKIPYAGPIHYGWFYDRNNFIKKNIKPNPFLARALNQNFSNIMARYNESVQKILDRFNLGAEE